MGNVVIKIWKKFKNIYNDNNIAGSRVNLIKANTAATFKCGDTEIRCKETPGNSDTIAAVPGVNPNSGRG